MDQNQAINVAPDLAVLDLGRMSYAAAYEKQEQMHAAVVDARTPPGLLLVEHDPVITISRRPKARRHLLADKSMLGRLGIDLQETNRGGDITYHGPGQIVAYPILHLGILGMNIGQYMRMLEQVVIDTVAAFGIAAKRVLRCTGVWVDNPQPHPSPLAKLAALGVRVKRNVTLHGLALNVTTNLAHYETIVPCGLVGRPVTSLERLLDDRVPTMETVKAEMVHQFRRHVAKRSP